MNDFEILVEAARRVGEAQSSLLLPGGEAWTIFAEELNQLKLQQMEEQNSLQDVNLDDEIPF